jgi:hypothetical protein
MFTSIVFGFDLDDDGAAIAGATAALAVVETGACAN